MAVVEEGNFSRAAAALRISPSTLSQTIRELERNLGIQLLNRTTRNVSVTDAGQRLMDGFKPALANMQAVVEAARNVANRPAGTVRVQIPRPAFVTLLEPVLYQFYEAYPAVVLDLTIEDTVTNIVEARFDIGVRLGELLEQDMVGVAVGGDVRQVAVASPDYVVRHGMPQTPADLHAHRCINWRWPGTTGLYAWEFARDGKWFSVAVNGPLIVSHRDAALSAALQGVGIAFWSELLVRPFIVQGRLVPLLEEFSPPFSGWHLTFPKQRHMPPAVRCFVDFMRRTWS